MKLKGTKWIFIMVALFLVAIANKANVNNQRNIIREVKRATIYQNKILQSNYQIDSIIQHTPFNDLLGQLFMVAAFSNKDEAHKQSIATLIQREQIGGLCFFQGSPYKQAVLTNYYQSISKVPLFISIDAEWGLAMRLDSTIAFPYQIALGAIQDNDLIKQMGIEIARQCRLLGIHINFAPAVDINNNALNPVIGFRSFGENKYNVAEKGLAYAQGLQQGNVMACAKHFPGHGDVTVDSHLDLPVIPHSKDRLDSIEFYPFKQLFINGIASTMVAHLNVPSLDNTPNLPTTLSQKVIHDVLRRELGFTGLTFTDALNMKGVSKFYKPGEVEAKALLAGNDILLYAEDVTKAKLEINKLVAEGKITKEEIVNRIRQILQAKMEYKVDENRWVDTYNLTKRLNSDEAKKLNKQLVQASLTLAKNANEIVPIKELSGKRIACLSVGSNSITSFQRQLKLYTKVDCFNIEKNVSTTQWTDVIARLKSYDLVIVGIHSIDKKPANNFGLPNLIFEKVQALCLQNQCIVNVFGSPYLLGKFTNAQALTCGYAGDRLVQELMAQNLFGANTFKGKLPISAHVTMPYGTGYFTSSIQRLQYLEPYDVGANEYYLNKVDSLVAQCIQQHIMPGCQIVAAKSGKVFFNKCFGNNKYDNGKPVEEDDIYDLASLTKVVSTAPILMQLYDEGKLDPDERFSTYAPILQNSNKSDVLVRDVFTHTAGFKSWIAYYKETLTKKGLLDYHYRTSPQEGFSIQVANNIYLQDTYRDSIFSKIAQSNTNERGRCVYSDLSYYLWPEYIYKTKGNSLDNLTATMYENLGASTTGYLPLHRFSLDKIIPSEYDTYFRKQLLQGYVHDMGAAMMGGVSGHAGVFSNANDVAKIFQMFANGGLYGGKQYIQSSTVHTFTARQCATCRKGWMFDKPEIDPSRDKPTGSLSSYETFGHTGFTGTCAWYDPKNELLYVFLSNRTYPTMDNNKLNKLNIRTQIHDYFNLAVGYNLYN